MTSQLQQAINIAQNLSLVEQLELLKILSISIQKNHSLEVKTQNDIKDDTDFSSESFRKSWQQAVTGKTLPISQLWEDINVD
ncbi:hypothetical protein PN480_06110 [Dolichospermum circinale CS-1225]|uniref:Addiction module component n=1 Tax=Dolichospermum circinale CS-537/01 TaxID=3021739 RepID=A0ABT5A900_9CYAN|nr:hypothetical protein [Dolichospermum circinale]MDB9459455.1 hypothetical protein [Dolichospermum circinale CS-545/17]MDB9468126.1 hypothetical protein [Dolichospermum circinale CS-539/09]MDB9470239.1 hypothetical protein [Dolichospermum circinale CS-539]MDB9488440.1 hypothetical protein [Dolichospermum circinale CS-537/01]MDB9521527.1 hypothetical protein [Dolichospermum circinale CS-1225]